MNNSGTALKDGGLCCHPRSTGFGAPFVFLLATIGIAAQLISHEVNAMEIDVGKILWKSHSNAQQFFGKPVTILRPRIPAEGWEYQYAGGNATVGSRQRVLLVGYRYKKTPKNWQEALEKVGLPTDIPPVDLGTSYVWSSVGTTERRPIKVGGKVLNRVILPKDMSEITVDGHEPGTY